MNATASIRKWAPILQWLPSYEKSNLRGDLSAGMTVAVMLIPQGMAYAVLAGLPPVYGLYASILPLLLYAVFGTSRQLAVGPVAMVSLIIFAGISEFAQPGTERFIQLAILATLGVGVIQTMMGTLKMGFLVNFLSHPVLSGFTSAAAIIIGASQLKNLFGLQIPGSMPVLDTITTAVINLPYANLATALIGIGSVILIIGLKKWKKSFPSALVVVLIGTGIVALLDLNLHGVAIVGDIPKGFPAFSSPEFNVQDLISLMPVILVISLVGYMESIAIAKSIANRRQYKIDSNQELIGLGMANIGGAFFQSFPVTGGLSRTAVNDQAGAETPLAAIISAVVVAFTVAFLTPLFYYLPQAVLAAIIIVAVSSLFDSHAMKVLWKTDRRDLALLLVTFISTLSLGIETGIAIGVILSLVIVIYNSTKPHSAELGRLEQTENYRNLDRYPEAVKREDVIVFRYDSPLYFASSNYFLDRVQELVQTRNTTPKLFILDAASVNFIDSTGMHSLEELLKFLDKKGIKFAIAGVIGPVRDKLKQSGIMTQIGMNNFFFDVAEAMRSFDLGHDQSERDRTTNVSYHPAQANC